MAIYYGLSSNNCSSFFSSGLSNKSSGIGLYGSLGDYGLIRRGSYSKLCKAYYAKQATSSDDKDSKTDKELANDAGALKKSANDLSKMEFTEANAHKVMSAVKNFVKSYNSMISSAENSESSSISNAAKYLASNTKANANLLKQVGITVGSNNELSIDSKVLDSAKMSDLKTLFKGNSSFAGRVSSYATSIYMTAMANNSSLYSNLGSFEVINSSSLFDSSL